MKENLRRRADEFPKLKGVFYFEVASFPVQFLILNFHLQPHENFALHNYINNVNEPVGEKRLGAFTLIELLVVIAIIGILTALLLPALSAAKDRAAVATDLNNLKEQTMAIHLYATDNHDSMPWPNWAEGDEPGRPGWLYTPPSSVMVLPPGESAFDVETGVFWPILLNPQLYFCPKDGPGTPLFNQRVQQISSYVINGALCGYTNVIFPPVKLGELPPDGVAFWETDEKYPSYFNDGASYPSEGISTRHQQGGVYGAFDGSVGFIKFYDWYAEANSPTKNRLWCYPRSVSGH
jgi:prepilin-type N-terminal cleavage/methylation domain-containing protein